MDAARATFLCEPSMERTDFVETSVEGGAETSGDRCGQEGRSERDPCAWMERRG